MIGRLGSLLFVCADLEIYRYYCKSLAKAQRDIATERLVYFREWFLTAAMAQEDQDAVVIVLVENLSLRYRDESPT